MDELIKCIVDNWVGVLSIGLSLLAVVVSIKSWHKSRAIYGIEFVDVNEYSQDKINKKLSKGEYQMLNFIEKEMAEKEKSIITAGYADAYSQDSKNFKKFVLILGKIKK